MQLKPTALCIITFFAFAQLSSQNTINFNPTIKVKSLVQSRFEASLSDSIDIQNRYSTDPLTNNFRLRRAELRTDIQLNEKFSAVIRLQLPELKGSNIGRVLELAYLDYKWSDKIALRSGQFKMPYELDELTSHEDLRMVDRGTTSALFVSNNLSSYQPGLMLFGTFMKDKNPLNYFLAVANGSSRAVTNDNNSQKNLVARLEYDIIKDVRIAVNGQNVSLEKQNGLSYGADLSIQKNITPKTKLIVEGEYIQGIHTNDFSKSIDEDTMATEFLIDDFTMMGYFAQALFKIDINKSWCQTLEIGGKYENTDPNTLVIDNDFTTITGNIGFTFLPKNTARLQLNMIHTNWASAISPGGITAGNMFVAQFQLKI